MDALRKRLAESEIRKLDRIDNPELHSFIADQVELLNPSTVFIGTDAPEDLAYVRRRSLENGEEISLALEGHTIHFDNYGDQGRDKKHTGILVTAEMDLGDKIETIDRDHGLEDIKGIMRNIMEGKELFVRFFCLGPVNSEFSIPCVQLTDSAYVAHSEDLLYRQGFEEFVRQERSAKFFRFVHSQGELDERKTCKNLDGRRIYIDVISNTVYSANTQYGGNTLGLKKLAMRLAIRRGAEEGWLTEHMLVMGIHGPAGRITYFTGAFPSMCGKTSTAMLDGETILGDDIAYLRKRGGAIHAVNVEKGMFGIIQGVNSKDDPIQWKALHSPNEIIFSNVLKTDECTVHWLGRDGEVPEKGINHSGKWWPGKKDYQHKEIPCSHPNARFTISLSSFENVDSRLHDPEGVVVGGVVYGGRDSDTSVPVEESYGWEHGIVMKGAALESETTAATLGKVGVREFNPMSNLDFLSISIGRYVETNLDFAQGLEKAPPIFSVNYFLKDKEGRFLNEKTDKKVWFKWMELRAAGDVAAIETPTGRIPRYEDLHRLFREVLDKEYTRGQYEEQFTLRILENLMKIERIRHIYTHDVKDAPAVMFKVLEEQKARLERAREKLGDYIAPSKFEEALSR
jgi:phosphoenolpyruvate carboxykinase (GTP)